MAGVSHDCAQVSLQGSQHLRDVGTPKPVERILLAFFAFQA